MAGGVGGIVLRYVRPGGTARATHRRHLCDQDRGQPGERGRDPHRYIRRGNRPARHRLSRPVRRHISHRAQGLRPYWRRGDPRRELDRDGVRDATEANRRRRLHPCAVSVVRFSPTRHRPDAGLAASRHPGRGRPWLRALHLPGRRAGAEPRDGGARAARRRPLVASHALTVGVVVVNWNGWRDTLACLESLARATPGPRSVVVVDNGSTDGSVDTLTSWAATRDGLRVVILAAGANRGFSAGNNLGLAHLARDSGITHFLLLNNDATVAPTFFAEMARALEQVPAAGLVGATIYEAGASDRVWYAGGHFLPVRSLVVHRRVVPPNELAVPTDFVTGCTMLISRAALRTLGPLPECYFLY